MMFAEALRASQGTKPPSDSGTHWAFPGTRTSRCSRGPSKKTCFSFEMQVELMLKDMKGLSKNK